MHPTPNIILIGMPASGKSTIATLLAQRLGIGVVDTDALLEAWWGAPLQAIVNHLGPKAFIQAEAEQISRLMVERCVIATGGSVVYSAPAMQHLSTLGYLVYLQASVATISKRLGNPLSRGLVIGPGQDLQELYNERTPLYAQYAQLTVPTDSRLPEKVCTILEQELADKIKEIL